MTSPTQSVVHCLPGSGLSPPDLMEGFAAQARRLRETTSLPDHLACALRELEHRLETEANRPERQAALLAEAEAEGALA